MFIFALAFIAKFQPGPYKHKRNNTVGIIMLLTIIIVFISSTMHYAEEFMYPRLLSDHIVGISVLIILDYQVLSLSWLAFFLRLYSAANTLNQDDA